MMGRFILRVAIPAVVVAVLVIAGCSGGSPAPAGGQDAAGVSSSDSHRYDPVWVTPEATAELVSLPVNTIEQDRMVHFWMNLDSGKQAFMAYEMDGTLYVRASICPPCRSIGFSIEKGILVCDTCGTRFDAKTGAGVSGACRNYPKEQAAYTITDGKVVAKVADLAEAHAATVKAG